MTYALGAVKPFVADVANRVGPLFGVTDIGGWRASAGDMGGHPAGRALDFQVGADKAKGDRVAAYMVQNASGLLVDYVIWQQRVWRPATGWRPMAAKPGDRPGYDPNHMRHVHVSFRAAVDDGRRLGAPVSTDASGLPWWVKMPADAFDSIGGITRWIRNGLDGVVAGTAAAAGAGAAALLSPAEALGQLMQRSTWLRVVQVVGGGILMLTGLAIIVASSNITDKAATLLVAAPNPAAKAAGVVSSAAKAAGN